MVASYRRFVAAQSVSLLGSQLAPGLGDWAREALLFCLAMGLGGGMLYWWIISLIFYRYTFFERRKVATVYMPWRCSMTD